MKHFRSANLKKNTFQDMKHFATSHCLKFAATSQRFAEKWLKRYYLRGCPFAFSCQRTTCISCLLPCYLNKRSNNDKCSKVRNLFQSFTMSARCSTVLSAKRFQTVIWCDYSRELPIYSFHFISDCQIRFGTRL